MRLNTSLWFRTAYARAWVRTKSIYGEPLWLAVNIGFPFFTSMALALLYTSAGLPSARGFAILGGVMVSFWGNVLWSMASQFNWDKQVGLFELYISSPAPISAILVGMSWGGILGTVPSATMVALLGWALFHPIINAVWPLVALIFSLTLASLYAMGMALSSLYLVYGREADSVNEALHEPVSYLSGVYFDPAKVATGPAVLQAIALLIPLGIGMDALRKTLFPTVMAEDVFQTILPHVILLSTMGTALLILATKAIKYLEKKGRESGTISVRLR